MSRTFASAPVATAVLAAVTLLAPGPARAGDPPCGAVEVRLRPGAADMQMVVWIEDGNGHHIDTAYITRLTGQFGLGNRPGAALLKTDFRWPYGRREMVAPVWAHRRDHRYPKVVMGGVCGNSPQSQCPNNGGACQGDCEDSTIAYHSRVSSYEPFFCSPSGASLLDAMSCASKGTFAKGAYRPFPGEYSLYPPRADLTMKNYSANFDSPDLLDFAKQNDLVAVSQATPPKSKDLNPPLDWFPANPLPPGDYVAWVELSQESDFNNFHKHANQADSVQAWDFEGHAFLGQPSVVYKIPFHYDAFGGSFIADRYAGYSTWDGSDGVIHPADGTISDLPGSGAGRLLDVNDGIDVYRVKVVVGACQQAMPDLGAPADLSGVSDDAGLDGDGGVRDAGAAPDLGGGGIPTCKEPAPAEALALSPTANGITVTFRTPASGEIANRFSVRYHEATAPIDNDADFNLAVVAPAVLAEAPGTVHTVQISGLQPKTSYAVAVRGVATCNRASAIASAVVSTSEQKFATLNGCFVATAAYGSPLDAQIEPLRRFRNRHLLTSAAGRLFVAGYYAFGPSLAAAIARDEVLRAAARRGLEPLVGLALDLERAAGR